MYATLKILTGLELIDFIFDNIATHQHFIIVITIYLFNQSNAL